VEFLDYWLPRFEKEGKSYLSIGICRTAASTGRCTSPSGSRAAPGGKGTVRVTIATPRE
jgi:hypothetical protein